MSVLSLSSENRSAVLQRVSRWLDAHSVTVLRLSLGLVFLAFAIPKYVPGLSPAADLAAMTIERLTLGLVGGGAAVLMTAVIETVIGLTLLSGRFLRAGLAVLAVALVGILSPLVLFPGMLFAGGPTLEAQYVVKDIVLVAAALVVASRTLGDRPQQAVRYDRVA